MNACKLVLLNLARNRIGGPGFNLNPRVLLSIDSSHHYQQSSNERQNGFRRKTVATSMLALTGLIGRKFPIQNVFQKAF